MAKPLVFQLGDTEIAFDISKVDRSKLYGYKDTIALDGQDQECELATLAADGRTLIGRGGTGMGYVSADGSWCEKNELTPIDLQGNEITPVKSSFSAPVKLFDTVSADDYLQHNIRLVYELETEADASDLVEELQRGTIFAFPYSFRGGLEADAGFLLMSEEGSVFLVVGSPTDIEFIGLQQPAAVVSDEDMADEEDTLDFDMI